MASVSKETLMPLVQPIYMHAYQVASRCKPVSNSNPFSSKVWQHPPAWSCCSTTTTLLPAFARRIAAVSPPAPLPITMASRLSGTLFCLNPVEKWKNPHVIDYLCHLVSKISILDKCFYKFINDTWCRWCKQHCAMSAGMDDYDHMMTARMDFLSCKAGNNHGGGDVVVVMWCWWFYRNVITTFHMPELYKVPTLDDISPTPLTCPAVSAVTDWSVLHPVPSHPQWSKGPQLNEVFVNMNLIQEEWIP